MVRIPRLRDEFVRVEALTMLTEPVLDAESAPWIGPLDIIELIADDPAGATLDAALVGEQHPAVLLGRVAGGGATIDALLADALQANIMVDDANVGTVPVDVERVERQLALDGGRIEDSSPVLGFRFNWHTSCSNTGVSWFGPDLKYI
jgi:hypothetical protein